MRYLKNRNEFLNKKVDLDRSQISQYYSKSKLIRETFENDITWGGSLLGRLINSTIRLVKAGIKTAQMPAVVESLKAELDNLVISSTQKEFKEKITLYRLKSLLAEIKAVCLEPSGPGKFKEEVEILDKLIGLKSMIPGLNPTDIASSHDEIKDKIYDPNDVKKNQSTKKLLQVAHNTITDDLKEDLEKIIGKKDTKLILDIISDFNDRVRKYVYELTGEDPGGSSSDASTTMRRFSANFNQVLNAIALSGVTS